MQHTNHKILFDNIPSELTDLLQWVCWIEVHYLNQSKPDKIPVNSATGRNASHSAPKTWGSYQRAKDFHENRNPVKVFVKQESVNPVSVTVEINGKKKHVVKGQSTGIGFVFSETDLYVGIDLDHCIKAGVKRIQSLDDVEDWACDFIGLCATYSEVSPSGTGIKLILKGKMLGNKGRRNDHYETGGIEIYPHHRFFTLTGQHLEGTPLEIAHNTDALVEICNRVFGGRHDEPKSEPRKPSAPVTDDDRMLIERAKACEKNGAKFTRLWEGNLGDHGDDHSRADLALCSYLAFWTQGDAARMDSLFRQSGLMRDKWDRDDYRSWTLEKAIEGAAAYDPNYRSDKPSKAKPQTDGPPSPSSSEPNGEATPDSPPTEASEAPASDDYQPSPEAPTPEAQSDDIRREILKAGMMDEGFNRTEKTKAIINRLVGLEPVNQSAFIERMRKADLGTKAVLEDQLKSAEKSQAQEKRQTVIHQPQPSALPYIVINTRQMREVTDDTLDAIQKDNADHPSLFVRSGLLTRIKLDEKGYALAQNLTIDGARGIMGRTANFLRETAKEEGIIYSAVSPPEVIAKDILSLPSYPHFKPLVSVVGFPILSPSGEFRTQTGYDPESRCYYHAPEEIHIGETEPTRANLQNAKLILEDILGDFPFADDKASKANTVAELLTPLVRTLISGATPLFAHDAATPGTGKSLLASVCTLPFSVSGTSVMTAGRDDDEWRKRITAKLMTGASHILIDNVKSKLYSGDLAAALTALIGEDRFLGQTLMVRLPVRCTWIATGNNLSFSDEIARRTVWIRLDAKMERPWQRKNFRHPKLESWVGKHRSEVLTALMVMVKRWFAEGKPEGEATLGSYDEWAGIVGGILTAVGIEGFLSNAEKLYDTLDSEREMWVDFFQAWAENYGAYHMDKKEWGLWAGENQQNVWKPRKNAPPSVGVRDLFSLASHYDDKAEGDGESLLDDLLGQGKETARRTNLGRLLKKYRDRVFGGYRLEMLGKEKRAQQFRLMVFGEPSSEPSDLGSLPLKTNDSTALGAVSHSGREPSEPKTTPSGKIEEKGDTLSINTDGGAGLGSLGSLGSPPDARNPNDSTALSQSEPKLARFTSDEIPKAHVDFILAWYEKCGNHPAYTTVLLRIARKIFPLKMGVSAHDQMKAAIEAMQGKVVRGLQIVKDGDGYHLKGAPEMEVIS